MRKLPRLALAAAVAVIFAVNSASAQDPAPTPESAPAPATGQSATPSIDDLREPGSSAKFLPPETPAPSTATAGQGAGARTDGRRSGGLPSGGQHRRNERSNDLIADQADADPLAVRVAYRRAKTAVMARDPGLAELLRQAADAHTDVQKRAFLKVYYTRLYTEVRRVDPSPEMKKHVELLSQVTQQRYDPQRRAVGGEEDLVRGGGGGRGRRGRNR